MQFFKHSCNMSGDIKIQRVMRKYGLEGYGLYNIILERICRALSSDSPIPELEETAQDIAEQYKNDTVRINEIMLFMLNQGLFEQDEITGRILCHKIYKFLDKSQTRSPEIRMMIERYRAGKDVPDSPGLSQINLIDIEKDIDIEVDIDKEKERHSTRFSPPSPADVRIYLDELNEKRINPNSFCDYYESKGWMVGKNKMKSWKAAIRTWIQRENEKGIPQNKNQADPARIEEIRKIIEGGI